jgi:MoxR-like ATPase
MVVMTLGLLDDINYGYQDVEPVVVGLFARGRNFMLMGRHGTGKTRLAKTLASGLGAGGFVFYDATKEDMISIAGIPDPEAIRSGKLAFTAHQRTIWDKNTIVVDEISRANRESQNLWLEILEERTCFGLALSYRCLIATANPESYAAAFRLDAALLDRFYAVVPVPDHQEGMTPERIDALLGLSFAPPSTPSADEIARTLEEIQAAHTAGMESGWDRSIRRYVSTFAHLLLEQIVLPERESLYASPRLYGRTLPETIAAVAAYYDVAGADQPLVSASWDAVRFSVATRLGVSEGRLNELHLTAVESLKDGKISEGRRLRMELTGASTFEERLEFISSRFDEVKSTLAADELERFLGDLLRGATAKGEKEKLVVLSSVLTELGYTGDLLRQVDGHLVLTLNKAVTFAMPLINQLDIREGGKHDRAWQAVSRFKALVQSGGLMQLTGNDAEKLKQFLIDVYEEDIEATPDVLVDFFSEIELPERVEPAT